MWRAIPYPCNGPRVCSVFSTFFFFKQKTAYEMFIGYVKKMSPTLGLVARWTVEKDAGALPIVGVTFLTVCVALRLPPTTTAAGVNATELTTRSGRKTVSRPLVRNVLLAGLAS